MGVQTSFWGGYYAGPLDPGTSLGYRWLLPANLWLSTFSVNAVPLLPQRGLTGEVQIGLLSVRMIQPVDDRALMQVELHTTFTNTGAVPIDLLVIHLSRVGQ
jgi:hypothetical protein